MSEKSEHKNGSAQQRDDAIKRELLLRIYTRRGKQGRSAPYQREKWHLKQRLLVYGPDEKTQSLL